MTVSTIEERRAPHSLAQPESLDKAFGRLFALEGVEATELYLVRHGQTDYEAARDGDDPTDPPLTNAGRAQAMRLAMRLRDLPIDALYASTMRRALETAAYIAASRDLPIERADALREVRFDPTFARAAGTNGALSAELAQRFLLSPKWDALPGFEPSRQFRSRVIQAIEAIVARHPGQRVVVVAHGGVINAYLSMVLGIQRDMFFLPTHTSVSSVRVLHDMYAVRSLNDATHLPRSLATF
jgi:broad specificity phosphatase PhoE